MKKLALLVVLVVLSLVLYRRLRAPARPGARPHQHGTPDHWPPVVRKPGSDAPVA